MCHVFGAQPSNPLVLEINFPVKAFDEQTGPRAKFDDTGGRHPNADSPCDLECRVLDERDVGNCLWVWLYDMRRWHRHIGPEPQTVYT